MTKRIEFLTTELYESEGRGKGPTFPKGSVWDMTDEFAHRWVTMRGVAVELEEEPTELEAGQRYALVREAAPEVESEDAPEPVDSAAAAKASAAPARSRGAKA
jgi:hypothetical protein